jgi:predicted nucleic acid-binding protein
VTATLVDSSVLIDVFDPDDPTNAWSVAAFAEALERGVVFVNQIVFAEVSVGFSTPEDCEWALDVRGVERIPMPWPAAFLAGRAFVEYRRRGGGKRSPLPDFFIGAHAAVEGLRLLTRDPARIRTYFPTVELIAPGRGDEPASLG